MASECTTATIVLPSQVRRTNLHTLLSDLKACTRTKNFERGKQIHGVAVEFGHDCSVYVATALINMYAKCGRMEDARDVFDNTHHDVVSWNVLILGYANNGQAHTAIGLFVRMKTEGDEPNSVTFVAAIKTCTLLGEKEVDRGKALHNLVLENDGNSDIYVQSNLIRMYATCGNVVVAREVFDSIKQPDVDSWNALIMGYAANGLIENSLDMFARMEAEGPAANSVTFVAALKSCTSLAVKGGASGLAECMDRGKQIHNAAVRTGCDSHMYVQCTLVAMYAKCGSMEHARVVFDSMEQPDVVSWNVLILGYAENGQGHTSLDLFTRMKSDGPAPDSVTLVAALKACMSLVGELANGWAECRNLGEQVQKFALENGFKSDVYVQNTLVQMYSKCGSILDAQEVFDSMRHPDVVSWNILILGYADNGDGHAALGLLSRMRFEGPVPDSGTFVAALKANVPHEASQWAECRDKGKSVHNLAVENGCSSHIYVRSTLVDMYGKCGSMVEAQEVFDSIKNPDTVSWTALIMGYAETGNGYFALDLFTRMRNEGFSPDSVTLAATLKACISVAVKEGWAVCRERVTELHNFAVENGYSSDDYFLNSLIDIYSKCGSMVDARLVFDKLKHPTVVSWNVLMFGYADNGHGHTAMEIFTKMRNEGSAPNPVTFVGALKACTSFNIKGGTELLECRDKVQAIHNLAKEHSCSSHIYLQSVLVDVYSKCGSMGNAREVFDSMEHPDVVSWNVIILGYIENGQGEAALNLFTRMRSEGHTPNLVTFVAALKACGMAGALEFGRTIHKEIDTREEVDVVLVSCLVDFYAKCGSLVEAQRVFDFHAEKRDMITWTALLTGFSSCGDSEAVFKLFQGMQDAGFRPDCVTCLCILTCCSHAGLVDKGKECFDTMPSKYGIVPTIEHYNCMLDIFGRANKLEDAMALLQHMTFSPNHVTWMTILSACWKWKNMEVGRLALQSLNTLNDQDVTGFVDIWE